MMKTATKLTSIIIPKKMLTRRNYHRDDNVIDVLNEHLMKSDCIHTALRFIAIPVYMKKELEIEY